MQLIKIKWVWLLLLIGLIPILGCSGDSSHEVEQAGIIVATGSSPRAVESEAAGPEEALIAEINCYRQSQGLGSLVENTKLAEIASWQAKDMAVNNYFAHEDSLGRRPFVRMCELGFCHEVHKGENLAAGTAEASEALDLLKASPGHNKNLLNPNYTQVGVALACQRGTYYGCYWAVELAGSTPE